MGRWGTGAGGRGAVRDAVRGVFSDPDVVGPDLFGAAAACEGLAGLALGFAPAATDARGLLSEDLGLAAALRTAVRVDALRERAAGAAAFARFMRQAEAGAVAFFAAFFFATFFLVAVFFVAGFFAAVFFTVVFFATFFVAAFLVAFLAAFFVVFFAVMGIARDSFYARKFFEPPRCGKL